MGAKSVVGEARQIELAIELIRLGARMQVLEAETELSRERLLRLYKEVKGVSPPKGMLPFSADWFLSWQPNVQASLFLGIHRYLLEHTTARGIEATIKSYRLYLEHLATQAVAPVLSFTRVWTLLRYLESKLLDTARCTRCGGRFVVHPLDLSRNYVCGLCAPPSRAGKRAPPARAAA
jgi:flagellar transcriptional activator FlhC